MATGDAGFFETDTGHLRIIDRAKDVGKMADGNMFAPKYVENKLKFYPNILEAVVFGAGREKCMAFINVDMSAVGNWAERNNIAYSSYQGGRASTGIGCDQGMLKRSTVRLHRMTCCQDANSPLPCLAQRTGCG